MTTLRSFAIALPVAGILLAGCTGSPPGARPAARAAPSAAAPSSAAPPTTSRPATSRPAATVAVPPTHSVMRPDLSAIRNCADCRIGAIRHGVRPGLSAALLLGPVTGRPYTQRAVLVAYRTTTGRVLGQRVVPDGEYFSPAGTPTAPLPCDTLAHCFVVGTVGAHGGTAAAFAIEADGAVGLLVSLTASHPTFTTPYLSGEGVGSRAIVAIQSDCDPACAGGHRFWQVHRWAASARAYTLVGCAPYREETRPPAVLDPAACRA